MTCVSSVSYSFNINGHVASHVTPTRGLRQGDPISPYLFIMCAEALSSMIRKSVTQRHIHGVRVCRTAPEISHLFFADDSIFFTRASNEEVCYLKSILERYCRSSGQVINYEKSEISFSANVEPHVRTHISELLCVREVVAQPKYLGLPSVIGRSKKVVFQAILDKIKKKLAGWKEKTLSIGGKEILIKAVAQAMPMYVMNVFLLPDNLIDDIHKTLNCFWWGDGIKENPVRWCSWDKMCMSKFRGGIGFRHFGMFNRSLLAKQVWRMITVPTTLAAQLLKARYFPRCSFFDANVGYRPSYIWRSLISVKEIVRKGCKWNIGDGRHVNVWDDYWLEDHRCLGPKPLNCDVTYVRDLLNNDGDDWNRELLWSLFPRSISNKITSCYVSRSTPDTLYWHSGSEGQFTCKSAYYIALETSEDIVENLPEETNTLLRAIWNTKVPIKVKLFLWRVWKNYVPTIDNLRARGLNLASVSCTHCRHIGEDVIHVFFKCPKTKEVWDRCSFGRFYDTVGAVTFDDFCHEILHKFPTGWESFLMTLWCLWLRRNRQFHGQTSERDTRVEVLARQLLVDYHKANERQLPTSHATSLRWAKPEGDFIKVNCDASWIKESGKAGLGFVARNETGEVLLSGARAECYASSPLEAEAKAILWATNHCKERGYPKVIFESDSMCLVNALKKGTTLLQVASISAQIRSNSLAFDMCNWSFAKREGNKVAHSIANWALECNDEVILEGRVLECSCKFVTEDMLSSSL